jgi:hypothetical protein
LTIQINESRNNTLPTERTCRTFEVRIDKKTETIWLTQKQIADLLGKQCPAITKHLGNIFKSGELNENEVSSILEHTTPHGTIKGKTQKD